MDQFLDLLTRYSNLALVIITGVYAFLTWRMVLEMRTARENQTDANLIASPVPLPAIYAQVQLENAGPGPALNVELSISLDPPLRTSIKTWHHPALLVGQKEHFLLPSERDDTIDALRELAEKHKNLVINLKWKNIFGRNKSFSATYNLHDLAEGWYNAGHLIAPKDTPTQLKNITEVLDKIHRDLENIVRDIKK
jgi:hypothetical protein